MSARNSGCTSGGEGKSETNQSAAPKIAQMKAPTCSEWEANEIRPYKRGPGRDVEMRFGQIRKVDQSLLLLHASRLKESR